jgi:toxin ParE1/3/4
VNLHYTETALAEIDSLFSYVAERNPAAAAGIVARVEQVASRLVEFPYLGHPVDELDVRILPLGRYPYLIFYTVNSDRIAIIHVRHAARLRP